MKNTFICPQCKKKHLSKNKANEECFECWYSEHLDHPHIKLNKSKKINKIK